MERRIAAIVAADMVSFSRLVELDEAGTLSRQKHHFVELIGPAVERHNGSIIKTTGDGLIAEFPSVVDAVQCCVHIQSEMSVREIDVTEDRRIRYRIGINLGDVIFDDGDVFGDGVNIAARLEGLAEPGGIVVSGTAYDMLKSNVEVGYEALGERQIKNIETPVRVYRVVPEGVPRPAVKFKPPVPPAWRVRRRWAAVAALIAALLVAIAGWWQTRMDFEPVAEAEMKYPLPEVPSIAVVPLQNLGNPEDGHLAEGFSNGLITALSSQADFLTIQPGAAVDADGEQLSPREVGINYGSRLVLSGTVQKVNEEIEISVRLDNVIEGTTIWSKSYRIALDPKAFFDTRNEVLHDVLVEVVDKSGGGEWSRRTVDSFTDFETQRLMSEGHVAFQLWTPEGTKTATRLFREALAREPDNPWVMESNGWAAFQRLMSGMARTQEEKGAAFKEAYDFASSILETEPEQAGAHALMASLKLLEVKHDDALMHARKHVRLAGSGVQASVGWVLMRAGAINEAEAVFAKALRTHSALFDWVPVFYAETMMWQGRHDEAFERLNDAWESGLTGSSARWGALSNLAYIAVESGNEQEARNYVALILKDDSIRVKNRQGIEKIYYFWRDQNMLKLILDALVTAGLPKE